MIYFISKKRSSFKSCTLKDCIDYFKDHAIVAVDTETTGLNFLTDKILLIQLGDSENQFVIDTESEDIAELKTLLESKTLIMHNAKFDLKFLFKQGIRPNKVFDTMLAEIVLNTGLMKVRVSLDKCLKRYFKIEMPKEIRNAIAKLGVSETRVIEYSANDVKYLHKLMEAQMEKIKSKDLETCLDLENQFVIPLSYIEFCGFKIDMKKWEEKNEHDLKEFMKAEVELDQKYLSLRETPSQLDIFGFTSSMINWSSPPQVVKVFEDLGINVTTFDKKTKKLKKSVEAKVLKGQKHEILEPYSKYSQLDKLVSTYGNSFLELANEYPDKRLRTNFTQIKSTGRLSSGGFGTVNFQNIPRVPEKDKRNRIIYERECFIPEKENVFVVADYSSQLGSAA